MNMKPLLLPATALAVCLAATDVQVAGASLPTLHLSAVVYDVHTSAGGTVSSHEKLSQGTKHVGEDLSSCVPNSEKTVHCTGSYKLSQGTFSIAGTISKTGTTNRLQITGGTGPYKHAHGTVVTEYNRAGTRAKETISFT
jgi:hypothetical protein